MGKSYKAIHGKEKPRQSGQFAQGIWSKNKCSVFEDMEGQSVWNVETYKEV